MNRCIGICISFLVIVINNGFSQQLKLGSNPAIIEKSAVLELQSNKQGLLFPRIADTSLINELNPPDGMVIFFTPSSSLLVRSNGYWQSLTTQLFFNNYWSTNGNSNGVAKRLGNIDNYAFSLITNNTDRLYISSAGNIGISNTSPSEKLDITGNLKLSGALMPNNNAGTSGYILRSNGANSAPSWINPQLSALSDISLSSPANGQLLQYNGTNWVNVNPTYLSPSRTINTTAPLTGGGDLSADRTLSISTNGISNSLIRQSGALSVMGNSTNATANIADITAGTDGFVLRRNGTTLGFGTIATAGITNSAVTYAKIQNISSNNRLLGRATTGAGVMEEITLGSGLSYTGTTLNITSVPNSALTNSTIGLTIGTTGTDANVSGSPASLGGSLTLNLPTASSANRGLLSNTDWNTFNNKLSSIDTNNISNFAQKVRSLFYNSAPITLSNGQIGITQASSTTNGYLSSADWNAFNNKLGSVTSGNLTESSSSVLTITGGTNSVMGNGTSIQVKQANTSQSGFLSNTDWNTFNSKLSAVDTGNINNFYLKVRGLNSAGAGISYNVNTGVIANSGVLSVNGNTGALTMDTGYIANFYQKARSVLSSGPGISYNAATGVISSSMNTGNFWALDGNATGAVKNFGTTDNYALPFITNNSERMRIDASGKIGIGVMDPGNNLVVKDALEVRRVGPLSQLLFSNTAGSGDFRIGADGGDIFWQGGGSRSLQMGSYWTTILAGDRQTSAFPSFTGSISNTGVLIPAQRDGSIPLAIQGNSPTQTANLTEWRTSAGSVLNVVDKNGNVGLGNISPSERLDITGNFKFSGALMPNNNAGTSGYFLKSNGAGTSPSWTNIDLGDLSDITLTSPVNGQILQYNGTNWVNTNNTSLSSSRTINTTAPLTGGGDLSADRTLSISTNGISNTLFRQSAALSVIGNGTNATANIADITAGTDGFVLRRSGTTLGFGTIATAGITNSAVTYAKIQNVSANNRLLGRATTGAGVMEEITLGSGLSYSGTTLNVSIDTSNITSFHTKVKSLFSAGSGITYNATTGVISSNVSSSNLWAYGGNTVGSLKNFGTIDNYDLPFITNNSEGMRLTTNNRLGINMTSPSEILDVNGNIKISGGNKRLIFSTPGGDPDAAIEHRTYSGSENNELLFYVGNDNTTSYGPDRIRMVAEELRIETFDNAGTSSLTNAETGSSVTRLLINSSGNIGIANSSPTEKLDVNGNLKFSGALMPNNNAGTSGYLLKSNGSGSAPSWINTVPVTQGGTGQTTANAGLNALLPSQSGNSGKVLTTDGSNTSWGDASPISDNYVYSYSTSTKTFSSAGSWIDITFNTAHPQLSGWSHSLSSNADNFTCGETGLYQVIYSGQVNNTSTSTYELAIRAMLDGNEIAGSVSSVACSNSNPTIANNFLVNINSGQVLKLQLTGSNTSIRLQQGSYGTVRPSITITIIKIK